MRGFKDEEARNAGVPFNVKVVHETDMAILVLVEGESRKWVPRSAVHVDSDIPAQSARVRKGLEGELLIQKWWVDNFMDEADAADSKPKKKLPPLPEAMSQAAAEWLEKLKANPAGLRARPSVALVELERRKLAKRSDGPGADTLWKPKGG
jgi:hypothetical protein